MNCEELIKSISPGFVLKDSSYDFAYPIYLYPNKDKMHFVTFYNNHERDFKEKMEVKGEDISFENFMMKVFSGEWEIILDRNFGSIREKLEQSYISISSCTKEKELEVLYNHLNYLYKDHLYF